jgi:hypothetical protein
VYGAVRSFDDFGRIGIDAKAHAVHLPRVALCQDRLDLKRRAQGSCRRLEHGKHAVACHVYDAST